MKYYAALNTFKFSWDQVTSAFWNRYPNPHSSHVLSEDVVDRDMAQGQLFSRRIISKTNKLPKWGERFASGVRSACVVEESVVDPKTKTFTTYTRNISLTRIMVVEEKCTYRPSPDNKGWTQCTKEAWVNSSLFGFSRAIQSFGVDRFKKNAVKATKGFEYILQKIHIPESIPDQSALLGNFSKEKLKEKAHQKAANALAKKGVVITKQPS